MSAHFDLSDLQAFRAVAERGSFRRAAEALHLSQPALSRRIEKLEQALEVKLLERTTRRVSLTAVGRDFARKAQHLLDELDSTVMAIRGSATLGQGEVALACVPSTLHYHVARVLQSHRKRYPRIRVRVLDGGANMVLGAVAQGDADFGLNFIGQTEPGIEFHPLANDRFVLACRRDHPLALQRRVTWAELARQDRVALAQTSGNRLVQDLALAEAGLQLPWVCETQHVTAQLSLVEAGLGVAAVPAMSMPEPDHPILVGVPLDSPVVTRQVGLIRRTGHPLAPAAQTLYETFLAQPRRER